jgi:histidinol dehydrogenase
MKFLNIADADFSENFAAILRRAEETDPGVETLVQEVIADIRARGDAALLEYTSRFDRLDTNAQGLLIQEEEIERAFAIAGEKRLRPFATPSSESAAFTRNKNRKAGSMRKRMGFSLARR